MNVLAQTPTSAPVDPAGLDRLHDIIELPPVTGWPPAPGWIVLACGVCALCAIGLLALARRYRQRRYRREAIGELNRLSQSATPREQAAGVAILLKRTALSAYAREQVASLSFEGWIEFLQRTDVDLQLVQSERQALLKAPYARDIQVSTETSVALQKAARHWIRHHRVAPGGEVKSC